LLSVVVHPANIQDRDGAFHLLRRARRLFPFIRRIFAWISRNRRLARDFERYATTAAAFIRFAMIRIILRRLAANASS
jgi:transposase